MASEQESATNREIKTQTQAWQEALKVTGNLLLPKPSDYDQVIFTGCGSTYYLSLSAAALYQELTGRVARAVPGGEMVLNPQNFSAAGRTLLVAVSRSGRTTETIKAVEAFKQERRGHVIGISNYDEALLRSVDMKIVIPKGQEESVAQTRSFASMYVAVCALCARMATRSDLSEALECLPEIGDRLIRNYESLAKEIGENLDYDRFYFLGSGIRYGLACEAGLKMKEMSLTHSEPYHFLEFRHGPISMVNEKAVVVGMLSEKNGSLESPVLNELRALKARVVALSESATDVAFESGVPENVRGVLYLPVLQLMAFHRSLAKGLNPDRPNNLTAVVQLNL